MPDGWDYAIPRTLIVRSFGDLVETPAPYMRDYMSSFFRMVLYQNGRAVSSGIFGKKENLYLLDYTCRFCGARRARTEKEYIAEKL